MTISSPERTGVMPEIAGSGVARYQVRYTCLDSEGDQQFGTDPVEGIAEAHLECARILEYQESRGLPEDASIWWRVGARPWQRWGGVL
ncbi:hypothetical protein [Nonomuraea sp. NPDC049129]|uniref:hypothetical protein n=1 Tax=Nonomuraea sp. NPDC049129 TaxID=3155272 RepID=UPI0033C45205